MCNNIIIDEYIPPFGVEFYNKKINYNKKLYNLQIWDCVYINI